MNDTRVLSEFISGHEFGELPDLVRERTKQLVLDHIGVSLFALGSKWCDIVIDYAREFSHKGECSVFGQAWKTTAQHAALANGVCAHGYELDDNHEGGAGHPGAAVIPAALAMAEKSGSTGRAFLLSTALGYEIMGRMGRALGREGTRQHHPTGQTGVFGAAAAAGKLLGFSAAQMSNALGVAGALASGVMEFTEDPDGSMIKRLYGGWPAQSGIVAASLAAKGFTGPSTIIEGRYGLLRSITSNLNLSALSENLGADYEILHVAIKPYACCRVLHPVVEAIAEIKRRSDFKPQDVTEVMVGATEKMIAKHMSYKPQSLMSAQYSLPFTAAIALYRDLRDPRAFDEASLMDADIRSACKKVRVEFDREIDAGYPNKFSAKVTLTLRGGRKEAATVWNPLGSPDRPFTSDEMRNRFRKLTATMLEPPVQDALIEAVDNLDAEDTANLRALCRLFAAQRTGGQEPGRIRTLQIEASDRGA